MTPRDEQSLLDIVLAGRLIAQFSAEISTATELEGNPLLASAIAWQFHIIGEATKRLGPDVRAASPTIPWSDMARLRDRVAHGYDSIDWTILWRIAQNDLPATIAAIEKMLRARGVDPRHK
ncbi:MAG: DUF86 domain-containing protein [Rhodospirillales bacterium]|nr:DUF86 domain-containing protein [Rhodospirillales bacterium]